MEKLQSSTTDLIVIASANKPTKKRNHKALLKYQQRLKTKVPDF